MRRFAAMIIALGVLAPRPAEACCEGTCAETERWRVLELRDPGPIPRDGVLLFVGTTGSALCIDLLAPRLDVEVRRGDEVLAGQIELADGRGSSFLWRPQAPWQPGAHHVRVTIDNDAIGPPGGVVEGEMSCPPACVDPGVLVFEADVTVDAAFSPAIPAIAAPELTLAVERLDRTMQGVTCCPGVIPQYGGDPLRAARRRGGDRSALRGRAAGRVRSPADARVPRGRRAAPRQRRGARVGEELPGGRDRRRARGARGRCRGGARV